MMKAKERYVLLISTLYLLLCFLYSSLEIHSFFSNSSLKESAELQYQNWKSKLHHYDEVTGEDDETLFTPDSLESDEDFSQCTMDSCFNLSRCASGPPFYHYVYPLDANVKMSINYQKILSVLTRSSLLTEDPSKACLFVLSLDTLDRDVLSEVDFVRNMQSRLDKLTLWNNGENHLVFNLYSGTYPDYSEKLDFNTGKAILARPSFSNRFARHDFDVSIPLFHPTHPEKGGEKGAITSNTMPQRKKYFLAFKGKRYVYGIGSETRNSLYHLHNGDDVVLLTTCKHGKSWKDLQDERCDEDNELYDRWDYQTLLLNSTFCLVPRGRRLGSFRFIETLQSGCIPVVLSNDWKLPFDEIIDWSQSIVNLDERFLLQVPELLQAIPSSRIHYMRQKTQVLWDRYFSSIELIIKATLEIIHDRIKLHHKKSKDYWNASFDYLFNRYDKYGKMKFTNCENQNASIGKLTFVINAHSEADRNINNIVSRLLKIVSPSKIIAEVVVVWGSNVEPRILQFAKIMKNIPVEIIRTSVEYSNNRTIHGQTMKFVSHGSEEAIFVIDYNHAILLEEVEFAFQSWQHFKERLVGLVPGSHFWDSRQRRWSYTSKIGNEYSMIMPRHGALFHRKYADQFEEISHLVELHPICSDILMNFVISADSQKPPIKILQKKSTKDVSLKIKSNLDELHESFRLKQDCFNSFVKHFGYLPLKKSSLRIDPVLFKDLVSNTRKKYKQLEH